MKALSVAVALSLLIGQGRKPQPLAGLQAMGERIVRAVVEKDLATLLAYDFPEPDFHPDNQSALEDPKSDLHCYVFDTRCNARGKPSVLEMFTTLRKLRIQPRSLGPGFAVLFFYDAAVVSARRLGSQRVLCREAGRHLVSWVFKMEGGRWIAANEPFDFDTDVLCARR